VHRRQLCQRAAHGVACGTQTNGIENIVPCEHVLIVYTYVLCEHTVLLWSKWRVRRRQLRQHAAHVRISLHVYPSAQHCGIEMWLVVFRRNVVDTVTYRLLPYIAHGR
jgi:hypothetical protein